MRLVSDMPTSNRTWKYRYFFVQGANWMCSHDEWEEDRALIVSYGFCLSLVSRLPPILTCFEHE